jgi:phosphoserine phosphatase RsbU/P
MAASENVGSGGVRAVEESERMQCMEVWGGNRGTNKSFEMPGLRTWVYSRPYSEDTSGGDVYYVSSCASGRITRILLADVMGHGTLAADTARGLRDLMRENINRIRQTSLVHALNQQFSNVARQGGFATALVGTFFAPRRSLAICNAGHPLPLVYRVAEAQWAPLLRRPAENAKFVDMPLGISDEVDYLISETHLDQGDLVLGFSDALPEASDERGKMLGSDGILALVQQMEVSNPYQLIPDLLAAIARLSPNNLAQDDLTIILLQVTGSRPRMKDNLLAPFRLFGKVMDQTEWVEQRLD